MARVAARLRIDVRKAAEFAQFTTGLGEFYRMRPEVLVCPAGPAARRAVGAAARQVVALARRAEVVVAQRPAPPGLEIGGPRKPMGGSAGEIFRSHVSAG